MDRESFLSQEIFYAKGVLSYEVFNVNIVFCHYFHLEIILSKMPYLNLCPCCRPKAETKARQ